MHDHVMPETQYDHRVRMSSVVDLGSPFGQVLKPIYYEIICVDISNLI